MTSPYAGMPDPAEMFKAYRDQTMEAWAKGFSDYVNTDAFAKSLGQYLDTALSGSGQFKTAFDQYMKAYLAALSLPSRDDITSLAQRLTSVEMRLDDLQYDAETRRRAAAAPAAAPQADAFAAISKDLAAIRDQLGDLAGGAKTTAAKAAAKPTTPKAAPRARRSAKAASS